MASGLQSRQLNRVIVADTDSALCRMIRNYLVNFGVETVEIFSSGKHVLRAVEKRIPDAVIVDYSLQPNRGGPLYTRLRELLGPGIPIVLISGAFTKEDIQLRKEDEDLRFIVKPFTEEILVETVKGAHAKCVERAIASASQTHEEHPAPDDAGGAENSTIAAEDPPEARDFAMRREAPVPHPRSEGKNTETPLSRYEEHPAGENPASDGLNGLSVAEALEKGMWSHAATPARPPSAGEHSRLENESGAEEPGASGDGKPARPEGHDTTAPQATRGGLWEHGASGNPQGRGTVSTSTTPARASGVEAHPPVDSSASRAAHDLVASLPLDPDEAATEPSAPPQSPTAPSPSGASSDPSPDAGEEDAEEEPSADSSTAQEDDTEANEAFLDFIHKVERTSKRLTDVSMDSWPGKGIRPRGGADPSSDADLPVLNQEASKNALLLVSDPGIHAPIKKSLERRGFQNCDAHFDRVTAWKHAAGGDYQLVVLDWEMLCLSGIGFYSQLRTSLKSATTGVVIISDWLQESDVELIECDVPTVLTAKTGVDRNFGLAASLIIDKINSYNDVRTRALKKIQSLQPNEEKCASYLVEMTKETPLASHLALQSARYYFNLGDTKKTERLLNAAFKATHGSLGVVVEQAKLYSKTDRIDRIREVFKKVQNVFAGQVERILMLRQNKRSLFRLDEVGTFALESFAEEAGSAKPGSSRRCRSLVEYLSKGETLPPLANRLASALNIVGIMHVRHEAYSVAIGLYQAALYLVDSQATESKVLYNLAVAYEKAGDPLEARECFRRSKALKQEGRRRAS